MTEQERYDLLANTPWGNSVEDFRKWAGTIGHYAAVKHADSYLALLKTKAKESQPLSHEESCACPD